MKTYRLVVAINPESEMQYKVVFENQHLDFNSQRGIRTRNAFFDNRFYQMENNLYKSVLPLMKIPGVLQRKMQIEAHSPRLKAVLTLLANHIYDYAAENKGVQKIEFESTFSASTSGIQLPPFSIFSQPKTEHSPYDTFIGLLKFSRETNIAIIDTQQNIDYTMSFTKLNELLAKIGLHESSPATKQYSSFDIKPETSRNAKKAFAIFLSLYLSIVLSTAPIKNVIEPKLIEKLENMTSFRKVKKLILHTLYPSDHKEIIFNRMLMSITSIELHDFTKKAECIELPPDHTAAYAEYRNELEKLFCNSAPAEKKEFVM